MKKKLGVAGASLPTRDVVGAAAVAGAAAVGAKVAWDGLSNANDEPEQEFRLRPEEPVPAGVRRVARAQLAQARGGLDRAPKRKLSEAVHETRKRLKRTRAVLRLSRGALDQEVYERENIAFRDTGRRLAGVRDAAVLIETLDGLKKSAAIELPDAVIQPVRARLKDEREQALLRLRENPETIDAAVRELEDARARAGAWPLRANGFDVLDSGLRRTYRRGRKAMRRAEAKPNAENFHEWRKRVKDLWHSLQLLRSAKPKKMSKLVKRAHRLSDLLGDDHDLAELGRYVTSHPELLKDEDSRASMMGAIDARRDKLQQQAIGLGSRVYAKRPKRFVKGIKRGWTKQAQRVGS
jgi:CHAD domain-containing protein